MTAQLNDIVTSLNRLDTKGGWSGILNEHTTPATWEFTRADSCREPVRAPIKREAFGIDCWSETDIARAILRQYNATADKPEKVDHPPHYNKGPIECIDAIQSALSPEEYKGFLKGQVIKYTWGCGKKDDPAQEQKKAEWYNSRLIKLLEEEKKG